MPASTTIRMSARPGSTQVAVSAGVASVTGAAHTAAGTSVKPSPGAVAISGAAGSAGAIVRPSAGVATVTAASYLAGTSSSSTASVSSIAALKTALADDANGVIILADGTYSCANATSELSNSLFFGSSFASRTRPVTIRPTTPGGVTFDGGGSTCGLAVVQGAHDLTFDGFRFANWAPVSSGVVYVSASYNLSFKNLTLLGTCLGSNSPGTFLDHGFYLSLAAAPGIHDILIEDCTVTAPADTTRLLHSAIQVYGSEAAYNITVRRLTARAKDGLLIWGASIHDCLFTNCTFTSCSAFAARQQYANTAMAYTSCTSTGSGIQGFYSPAATPDNTAPAGTTFTSCSWA